jgi:hypothetical protein
MPVNSLHLSLFKRANQAYYIGYYLNGIRPRKSTGATVKADGLNALREFEKLFELRSRSVSFNEFTAEFLAYGATNYSPKTLTLFDAVLERFSRLVPHGCLKEITPLTVDRYKAARLAKVKRVSVNVELRALRSAFATGKLTFVY